MKRRKRTARATIPCTFRLPSQIVDILDTAVARTRQTNKTSILVGLVVAAVEDGRLPKPESVDDVRQLRFL